MPTMPQWLQTVNLADLFATLFWVLGLGIFMWKVWPILTAVKDVATRTKDMLDDWFGEPARPGVPERPGVMVRLDRLEHVSTLAARSSSAAAISSASAAYDSKPNGGGSAMDHLKAEIHAEFATLNEKLSRLEGPS
jgi:hypothetical protein